MKLSTIILLWTLNFIATKCNRLKPVRKPQTKFYLKQQSEISVGRKHCTHRKPAYLSGTSAQGAHCSHAIDVFHRSYANYSHASGDMDSTVKIRCLIRLIKMAQLVYLSSGDHLMMQQL